MYFEKFIVKHAKIGIKAVQIGVKLHMRSNLINCLLFERGKKKLIPIRTLQKRLKLDQSDIVP